jgi:hypothetical protein
MKRGNLITGGIVAELRRFGYSEILHAGTVPEASTLYCFTAKQTRK